MPYYEHGRFRLFAPNFCEMVQPSAPDIKPPPKRGIYALFYWKAYLFGIPTLFIFPLVWMARIAEELKAKALEMGVQGPHTSWWHMFGWNTFGLLLFGPAVATHRFFSTLSKVEDAMNHASVRIKGTHI